MARTELKWLRYVKGPVTTRQLVSFIGEALPIGHTKLAAEKVHEVVVARGGRGARWGAAAVSRDRVRRAGGEEQDGGARI